jgi:hypothetical protein
LTTVACHFNGWETGGQANRRAFRYATPTNHVAYLRHASIYTASTYQQLKLLATSVKCLTALTQELINSKTHNHEKEQHLGTYPKSHRGSHYGSIDGNHNHELHGQRTILKKKNFSLILVGKGDLKKGLKVDFNSQNEIFLIIDCDYDWRLVCEDRPPFNCKKKKAKKASRFE